MVPRLSSFLLVPLLAILLAALFHLADIETFTADDFRNGKHVVEGDLFRKFEYKCFAMNGTTSSSVSGQKRSVQYSLMTAYRDLSPVHAAQDDEASRTAVVILHGATMGSLAYLNFQHHFVNQGFRTIVYDQYSRGFSDRLSISGTDLSGSGTSVMDVLIAQLLSLLQELRLVSGSREGSETSTSKKLLSPRYEATPGNKIMLYGVSLGAALAATFIRQYPNLVSAVGFQVPVVSGIGSIVGKHVYLPLQISPIGEFLARLVLARAAISRGEANILGEDSPFAGQGQKKTTGQQQSPNPTPAEIFEYFKSQYLVKGTEKDMLQILRDHSVMFESRYPDHDFIAKSQMPVLFQYARDDPEIPAETVRDLITGVYEQDLSYDQLNVEINQEQTGRNQPKKKRLLKVEAYEGGHFMATVNFEAVARAVVAFLREQENS